MKLLCRKLICCLLVISNFTLFGRLSITLDEQLLSERAAIVGNKSANTEELMKVTDAINRELKAGQKRFAVPYPFAIHHDEIVAFLKTVRFNNEVAFDLIMKQWDLFKKQQPIDSQSLTPEAKKKLNQLRNIIESVFSNFRHPFILLSPDQKAFENFIKTDKANQQLMMVRSTGREDSKEFANAGGNESISSAQPIIYFISKAIGKVVASYFGERSFNQRILSGNKRELFSDPFMPVLLQVMIGERPGKKDAIPTSGVIFSQEAEGRTPGVVSISSTWGHGEGVVNGLVPVDQFFVGPTDIIHSLLRIKTECMKTNKKYQLEAVPNAGHLQSMSSLTPDQINDLVLAARELELYYRWPQDIEFVIQNNIIYLVQTRPIITPTIEPSYVKDKYLESLAAADKREVYVIGAGGGAVQIINQEENIIIADTIAKALDKFLNLEDKTVVKAVIIGQIAPATSHEATNFRGAGKPVFYAKNLEAIEKWIKQLPMMLDPQRGLALRYIKTDQFTNPQDTLKMNEWLVHPIAKKTSILPQFWIPSLSEIDAQLQSIELKKYASTTALLTALAKASTEHDALEILATLNSRIRQSLVTLSLRQKALREEEKETYPELMQHLINIHSQFLTCAFEIMKITPTISTLSRITWLYPQVFLEALVRQVPYAQEFVDDYSLGSLLKVEREEETIVEQLSLAQKKFRESYVQLAKAGNVALVEQVQDFWQDYIKNLSTIESNKQAKVIETVAYVTRLGILPLWLNLSFFTAWDNAYEDADKCSTSIIEEFDNSKNLLDHAAQMMQRLKSFNTSQFDKPELFEKAWKTFEHNILAPFLEKDFPDTYDRAPQLAKFAFLMTLNKLVEVFDTSIKALESSREYSDKDLQARRFKQMVESYYALLKQLTSIKSIESDLKLLLDESTFTTLDAYLNHIYELLSLLKPSTAQLRPSRGFNVSAAALGSKADWSRSIGATEGRSDKTIKEIIELTRQQKLLTLEDMFTLTHQILLVTIGTLFSKAGVDNLPLPSPAAQLHNTLKSYKNTLQVGIAEPLTQTCSFIGFNLEKDILTYYYNMPVRNHSNTFSMDYNLKTKKTIFKVNFIGQARERWIKIADWIVLFSALTNLEFVSNPQVDAERGFLSFSWQISDPTIVPWIFKFFDRLQYFTIVQDIVFQSSLPLKEIANSLAPNQVQAFIDQAIRILEMKIKENPALFLMLEDLVQLKPLENQTIVNIVNRLPEIAATAPSPIRQRIFPFLLSMHNDAAKTFGFHEGLSLDKVTYFFERNLPQILDTMNELLGITTDENEIKEIDRFIENLPILIRILSHPSLMTYITRHLNDPFANRQWAALAILNQLLSGYEIEPNVKSSLLSISEHNVNYWLQSSHSRVQTIAYEILKTMLQQGRATQLIVPAIAAGIRSKELSIQQKTYELFGLAIKKLSQLEGLDRETVKLLLEYTTTKAKFGPFRSFTEKINQFIALQKAGIIKNYDSFMQDLFKALLAIAPKLPMVQLIDSINELFAQKDLKLSQEDHEKIIEAVVNNYKNSEQIGQFDAKEAIDTLQQDREQINQIIENWEKQKK